MCRVTGWILFVLLVLGIGRLMMVCDTPEASASETPTVITIEDVDGPAQQSLEPQPVPESAGPTLEQRVSAIESQIVVLEDSGLKAMEAINKGQEHTGELISLVGKLADKVKSIRSCECPAPAPPQASAPAAAVPPAPVAKPLPQRRIVMEYGDGCQPCDAWKIVEMPLAVADGFTVETTEAQGGMVPRFTVYYGHLFARQQGRMSHRRLKDIERALIAEWARQGN